MQLEKMTKIPDLLDIIKLSEKAESCWIKYEYLFHLVKMSDSVFSRLKIGDRRGYDNGSFSSCACDKSDYEHNVYSPSSSSACWTREDTPEYFVVAGKKPLSLVFKRSRSNSPVLKPKPYRSPLSVNKLVDNKAFSCKEHYDCRKNLDCEPQTALDYDKCDDSTCVPIVSNGARRNDTGGVENEQDYCAENACPIKNSWEGRELCEGGKHDLEDGDTKVHNCSWLLGGARKINSVCSDAISHSTENDKKLEDCNSDVVVQSKMHNFEILKQHSEMNSLLNVKTESVVPFSSTLRENKSTVLNVDSNPRNKDYAVRDRNKLETPLKSQPGIFDAEASENVVESSKVYLCNNQKLLQSSVSSCNNYKSKMCILEVSTSSVAVEIPQNNAILDVDSYSKPSSSLENQIPFSVCVNSAEDHYRNGQAMETFSAPPEIITGQLKGATCSVVENEHSGELFSLEDISSLSLTDKAAVEKPVTLASIDLPKVPIVGQGVGGIVLAKLTKETNPLKECNLQNRCSLQLHTVDIANPSGELKSVTTKTDVGALVHSEIADADSDSDGDQVCITGNGKEHNVSQPGELIGSKDVTVNEVSFPELLTSVPIVVNQEVTDDNSTLVSKNSLVLLVENCAGVSSAEDGVSGGRASIVNAAGETLHDSVECSRRDECEPMEHDTYEPVGSVEVIEHLRNPIDVSPECVAESDEELEILEVKGRAAYCNVATASHNLFPWDLEKEGAFSFPGDALSEGTAFNMGGVTSDTSTCGSTEPGGGHGGPVFLGLSNDPFICGLTRDSDDAASLGDGVPGRRSPAVGTGADSENACDRFLFEDKSECSMEMDDCQFLCPVDTNGALPFGDVEVKEDRVFGGVGTGDGPQRRESTASDSCTRKIRRGAPRGSRWGSTDGMTREAARKCEPASLVQKSSSDSTQMYGFSEETMDRIFDDSSGDVYEERSPLLYSSDEEKLHNDGQEEESCRRLTAGPCLEQQRLSQLQDLLSGVPPPPTVTFPQFCIDAMVARLRNFSVACVAGAPVPRVRDPAVEDVAKRLQWPDSRLCSFHGISYNTGRLSEEAELLWQKLRDRYVGSETASSLVGVPPGPPTARGQGASPSGRKGARGKGHSPGRRLSHLARRRHAFSSSSLLAAPHPDKRVILVDPRPKERSKGSSTSGKRGGQERTHVAPPCPKTGKRALFQTPPSKGAVDKVSVNSSKPTRRALFKSPPGGQPAVPGQPVGTGPARRTLWPTAGALHGIENCAKEAGKRPLPPGERVSAVGDAKCPRRSSRTPIKGSENRGRTVQKDLSTPHRKKLLWAVAESLRATGVGLQHPRFRACAATLARRCRDLLLAQPAQGAGAGSTSERMLHLANQHVQEVVRTRPA